MSKFLTEVIAGTIAASVAICTMGVGSVLAGDAQTDPTVTISLANYDTENSFTVRCIEKFIEYAEDASGGSIQFRTSYGGTLCSMAEEYEYLKSGSIDMVACLPPFYMAELPYLYAVNNTVGEQDVIDYINWLWFENEETAALVEKYTEQAGVVLLGSVDAGTTIIATTYEASSFDDMKGSHTLGGARDADVYISLGFNVATVDTTDAYDSLQRGVCDSYAYTPSSYYTNNIYEVAPYFVDTKIYGNSNTYLVSAMKWATLTENQQQIMRDAMKVAQKFSVETNTQAVIDAQGVSKENAVVSEEESTNLCQLMEMSTNTILLTYAENLGTTEDMMAFIKAKEEYTGITQTPAN